MDKILTEWARQEELFELLQTLSKEDANLLMEAMEKEYTRGYHDGYEEANRRPFSGKLA